MYNMYCLFMLILQILCYWHCMRYRIDLIDNEYVEEISRFFLFLLLYIKVKLIESDHVRCCKTICQIQLHKTLSNSRSLLLNHLSILPFSTVVYCYHNSCAQEGYGSSYRSKQGVFLWHWFCNLGHMYGRRQGAIVGTVHTAC